MRLSITKPELKERKSDERNVFELVNNLRLVAALTIRTRVTTTTPGDGAFKAIWTDTVPTGGSYHLRMVVIGRGTSSGCWYEVSVGLQNFAGTVSIIGATANVTTREDAAAMDERIVITGETVSLEVRDDGAQPMAWSAFIEALAAG